MKEYIILVNKVECKGREHLEDIQNCNFESKDLLSYELGHAEFKLITFTDFMDSFNNGNFNKDDYWMGYVNIKS